MSILLLFFVKWALYISILDQTNQLTLLSLPSSSGSSRSTTLTNLETKVDMVKFTVCLTSFINMEISGYHFISSLLYN